MPKIAVRDRIFICVYLLALTISAIHLYRKPIYAMDAIQYMGNALLMEDRDIVSVHRRVYAEINRQLPPDARRDLLGNEPGAPADQNKSRQERAQSPEIFAEFLPFFAIRPLYNQSIWLLSKSGLGLMRSAIVISVGSYFVMGVILLVWLKHYAGVLSGAVMALLTMMTPPLTDLGRETTSDALATGIAFLSLFYIFEKRQLMPGFLLLVVSIFFRTDFVTLAGPVLLVCWLEKQIDFWKAGALAALAVGSVLIINHFAGDYGIRMLYYRNFVGTPISPAEMTVRFGVHEYLSAFRKGVTLVAGGFFLPFLLLGVVGLVNQRMRTVVGVTLAYVVLHYLILPNWQERWVGVFYLACTVSAAIAVGASRAIQFTGDPVTGKPSTGNPSTG